MMSAVCWAGTQVCIQLLSLAYLAPTHPLCDFSEEPPSIAPLMAEGYPSLMLPLCLQIQLQVKNSQDLSQTQLAKRHLHSSGLCANTICPVDHLFLCSAFSEEAPRSILKLHKPIFVMQSLAPTAGSQWRGRVLMGMLLQLFQHNKARLL